MEIYRSYDGRWAIERIVDRYVVYDEQAYEPDQEVCGPAGPCPNYTSGWPANGLRPQDFKEVT